MLPGWLRSIPHLVLGIDPGLDMEVVFKPNAFVHTNRHWKDSGRRLLRNGGNGHCGYVSLLQLRAIMQGFAPHEVEDAFLKGCPESRPKKLLPHLHPTSSSGMPPSELTEV